MAATEIPTTAPSPSQFDFLGASRPAAFVVGVAVPLAAVAEPAVEDPAAVLARSDVWWIMVSMGE